MQKSSRTNKRGQRRHHRPQEQYSRERYLAALKAKRQANTRRGILIVLVALVLIALLAFGLFKLAGNIFHTKPEYLSEKPALGKIVDKPEEKTPIIPMSYETKYGVIDTEDYDYERAQNMGSEDPILELQTILKNPENYPEHLLEKVATNPESLHFVYDYTQKKGSEPATTLGKPLLVNNNIPLLLQFDERWGYTIYGDRELATSGCGPTTLCMAYSGLTGKTDQTPASIAKLAQDAGYYTSEGSSGEIMSTGANKLGLSSKQIPVSKKNFKTELAKDRIIICSMRPGDFTYIGHFIILSDETADGLLVINDPNSLKRSQTLWTYDVVLPQIKAAWSIGKSQK